MRRLCLLLLATLLVSCTNQQPTSPTIAPATAPTALPIATDAPAAPPTRAPIATIAPTATSEVAPTTQPEPTVSSEPTQEPALPLTPVPFGRAIQVQKPAIQGDDVSAIQRRLLALGYTQLGVADGIFGEQSAVAVLAFQQRNSLDADGIVGPSTWERLFSTSPLAADGAGPLVPIVDAENRWLIGASRDGRWVAPIDAGALMAGGESYTIYQPDGAMSAATGSQPGSLGIPCEETQNVTLTSNATSGVALGVGLNARPVPVKTGELQSVPLQKSIEKLLKANGIATPEIQLVRVLEADLDGDGNAEQIVAATRMQLSEADSPMPSTAAGDYSLVLVVNKDGNPVLVIGEYHPQATEFSAPNQNQLVDLLDLNGDGKLEIVVASRYFEGAATLIYTYNGGKVEEALVTGCGV